MPSGIGGASASAVAGVGGMLVGGATGMASVRTTGVAGGSGGGGGGIGGGSRAWTNIGCDGWPEATAATDVKETSNRGLSVRTTRSYASGGLLAFYLAVVYGVGRSIRSVVGLTRYRLMVDEMPDTRDLLDLCEGVYIARREKRLLRETELTEIVLRLFRSSETLLQLTGSQLKRHGE